MPEICRFLGIIIRMFAEPNEPHHRPHFHAYYQNHSGVIGIDTIEIIGGSLPNARGVSSKHGLNSIKENLGRIGRGCNPVKYHTRLLLFVSAMGED